LARFSFILLELELWNLLRETWKKTWLQGGAREKERERWWAEGEREKI